jgi:SAM-dependent methyltransferase
MVHAGDAEALKYSERAIARRLVMQSARDPYDAVAYPAFAYPATHPDRLAVMATLHGLSPAPVEQCRVLEIACNEGGNLIPMAYAIPKGEFVGFDLARTPIERGQERIRELGLKNIRIFQGDLLNAGAELGRFDYIIAHGLYSWVPEPVRDKLLALCEELLEPNGVAFVSYAAMPGSHLRKMLRDMMLFRMEGIEDPEQGVAEAIKFLHFLIETRPQDDVYRAVIENELKRMEARRPGVTFHDELSAAYDPVHFVDFVEHARKHALQYLSEAVLPPPPDPCYRFDTHTTLKSAAGENILRQEQFLDFLRVRAYRETLLCRANRELRRDFPVAQLQSLMVASQVNLTQDEETGKPVFKLPSGIKMESNHPAVNSMLKELEKAWPRALTFDELAPRLAQMGFALNSDGAALLMRLAISKFIEFRTWNPPVAAEIAERPRASAITRQEGRDRTQASTLLHSMITLNDPRARAFLQLLDGTRNRGDLLDAMKTRFPESSEAELAEGIEPGLRMFQICGVLEA